MEGGDRDTAGHQVITPPCSGLWLGEGWGGVAGCWLICVSLPWSRMALCGSHPPLGEPGDSDARALRMSHLPTSHILYLTKLKDKEGDRERYELGVAIFISPTGPVSPLLALGLPPDTWWHATSLLSLLVVAHLSQRIPREHLEMPCPMSHDSILGRAIQ